MRAIGLRFCIVVLQLEEVLDRSPHDFRHLFWIYRCGILWQAQPIIQSVSILSLRRRQDQIPGKLAVLVEQSLTCQHVAHKDVRANADSFEALELRVLAAAEHLRHVDTDGRPL